VTAVVVCGHVTLDRMGGAPVPGGSAWYAARTLAALGARPLLFTAAASDFPRDALAGVEARIEEAPVTTTFVNVYGPDGARTQRVVGAAPPLRPERLPPGWRAPDALLLAPVLDEVDPPAFAAAVRAPRVGLCVQGLVRRLGPGGAVLHRPLDLGAWDLSSVDLAVLGEDDVRGEPDLPRRLAAEISLVAFTRGARGCELRFRGGVRRVGVHPALEVDPTGAGDVFAAAFLLALARGRDPVEAARLGAAAGSIVVEGRGGDALARVGEAWERAGRVPVEG